MIIKKRRIRSLSTNLPTIKTGQKIIIGINDLNNKEPLLRKVGFEGIEAGTSILPSPAFGPISQFSPQEPAERDRVPHY